MNEIFGTSCSAVSSRKMNPVRGNENREKNTDKNFSESKNSNPKRSHNSNGFEVL
jgi:hypothetical protein